MTADLTYYATILVGLTVLGSICRAIILAYHSDLRRVPGPGFAKYTELWRVQFVWTGRTHEKYRQLHEHYGRIVRTAPNAIDISDPAEITTIYGISSKFLKSAFYGSMSPVYDGSFMPSMFSTRDVAEHRQLKRSVSQKYSMTSVKGLEYLVDPCSKIFTDSMAQMEGQVVDLGAWLQWYAFDVIGAITFSKRFGFMENRKDMQDIIFGIDMALRYGSVVGQIPWLDKFLLGNLTVRSAMVAMMGGNDFSATIINMINEGIKDYDPETARKEGRDDFLAYLQQQQQKDSKIMTHREMMNHLFSNLIAGSDTTGIALRAIFYYLMKNKRTYEKLMREIDGAADKLSPTITYAECLELPYLQACLKEAMRLFPSVSYPLERIVPTGGAKLCGEFIPEGTVVGINAAVVHYDTAIFGKDSHEFRPERWLDNEEETIKNMDRHLLTFGAGTRTCIGKNISIMEMGKLVPQVLRAFELEWASDKAEWEVGTWWFAKQSSVLVKMKRRAVKQ